MAKRISWSYNAKNERREILNYEIKKENIEIFKLWDGRRNPDELALK